ncbi:MAG: SUMF1/EgtB/PvdO family nonheme iron enzyme [Candidatus Aminicenantes bacterium]|nr:SUMF1/EgtB/PvdO family nonheme iron enzyme [Candidatus Aminicenantes bacterium]
MIKLKRILLFKCLAVLLVFIFIQGDLSIYGEKETYKERFLRAKEDYIAGEYKSAIDTLERIHRIGRLKGDLKEDNNEFLSQVHLLLAACYEQSEKFIEARENYLKALEYSDNPAIQGIDFRFLIEYQRLILKKDIPQKLDQRVIEKEDKKKKKKFPWLLVAGAVAVIAVALVLILKKKNDESSTDPNFDTTTLGIEWVNVPAGEFQMGDNFNEGMDNERPVHTVYLDEYRISKYEVTFDQYDLFCEETQRSKPDDRGWGRENRPVIYVSWYDAEAFCIWLAEKTGKNIHLPTEAQWEKAARGSDQRRYPWGNSAPDCSLANFTGCASQTLPVGTHTAGVSPYGVHDMAGNVGEFAQDWYMSEYYSSSPTNNPQGPDEGVMKINRGGGWINAADRLRCAVRATNDPFEKYSYIGFRICWE